MALAEVPFDLAEVKLAAPPARPGTVAKEQVIAGLCASTLPLVTVVAPAGYGKTTLLVALGGRRSTSVRLGCPRRARRRRRGVPQVHRRRDPRSRAAPIRGLRRVVGPGRVQLGVTRPARRERTGCPRPTAGAGARRSARRCQPILLGRARGAVSVCAGRLADRDREPGRAAAAARALASAGLGVRDSGAGPPAGRAGGRVAARSSRGRARRGRALRVDRADGGLGCRLVPHGTVVAGRGPEPRRAPRGFHGDDRFVSDYFRLELLSRLPAAEAQFLKYTSVLDRMCGGLCDAVLETTRSAHTLETLERTNCFVVPLDRRTGWYRYHHLFGELLRDELERSRARGATRAQQAGDGLVHCQRLPGGRGRLRARGR